MKEHILKYPLFLFVKALRSRGKNTRRIAEAPFSHLNCLNVFISKNQINKKLQHGHLNCLWGLAYVAALGIKILHHLNDPLDGKVPTNSNYPTNRKMKANREK